jgi:hypothetical protein
MATARNRLSLVSSSYPANKSILDQVRDLVDAGFAVHWLKPSSKKPAYGIGWPDAPVATVEDLETSYEAGNNVGVRLGQPSSLASVGFLHAIDIDIRIPELAEDAWAAFATLFPNIRRADLPEVASGSGGESRHLYFVTDRPFNSKLLARSDGKHRRADGGWPNDWEIELFGSGKQIALPPSIHPVTGKPYTWVREFDFDAFAQPFIPAAHVETLGAVDAQMLPFETIPPATFEPGQLETELAMISVSDLHYDDWIKLGQALHHQFGGSQEGLDLWEKHTRRSTKFTGDAQLREMRRSKWRSFGKYRGKPVTILTVRQWYRDALQAAQVADLEDMEDLPSDELTLPTAGSDFDDLIDAPSPIRSADESVFDIGLTDAAPDWKTLLAIGEKGSIEPNLHNLRLIVENDKRTAGVTAFNEFSQEIVQRGTPGVRSPNRKNQAKPFVQLSGPIWTLRDCANGDFWTEEKDDSIRAMIEAPKTQGGYGIKVPDRDLRAAINIVGRKNCFHPVREYLSAQQWDGTPRVERLFIDYLGAPDDAYGRDTARLMMIAGVARIFEPGCKWDYVVILQGLQGKRKSTFISTLAKNWAAELEGDMTDTRAMVEAMQKAWILEIPELAGFTRADVRHIKGFVSRQTDKVRLAYAKRAQEYRRQSIFCGSTNDFKFLKDDTGNRRFWPIGCHVESIDIDRLRAEVDQLWAEAVVLYRAMRVEQPVGDLPLYLTGAAAQAIAFQHQESAQVESADEAQAGQIGAWLDTPIMSGSVDDDRDAEGRAIVRNETCLLEIWVECLKKDRGLYNQQTAQMLGRAMRMVPGWTVETKARRYNREYGLQRVIARDVETPP